MAVPGHFPRLRGRPRALFKASRLIGGAGAGRKALRAPVPPPSQATAGDSPVSGLLVGPGVPAASPPPGEGAFLFLHAKSGAVPTSAHL